MIVRDEAGLIELGQAFGRKLNGGEVIELVGDIGAGKTTFAKAVAAALGVQAEVTSPSFTVMKEYVGELDGRKIYFKHYDFYRLDDAGLMRNELAEELGDADTVVAVEWAKAVAGVLPAGRIRVEIKYLPSGDGREVVISGGEQ
jgi:tRNA threonylcarbamoyladenosine biosynthesis protein TsaE